MHVDPPAVGRRFLGDVERGVTTTQSATTTSAGNASSHRRAISNQTSTGAASIRYSANAAIDINGFVPTREVQRQAGDGHQDEPAGQPEQEHIERPAPPPTPTERSRRESPPPRWPGRPGLRWISSHRSGRPGHSYILPGPDMWMGWHRPRGVSPLALTNHGSACGVARQDQCCSVAPLWAVDIFGNALPGLVDREELFRGTCLFDSAWTSTKASWSSPAPTARPPPPRWWRPSWRRTTGCSPTTPAATSSAGPSPPVSSTRPVAGRCPTTSRCSNSTRHGRCASPPSCRRPGRCCSTSCATSSIASARSTPRPAARRVAAATTTAVVLNRDDPRIDALAATCRTSAVSGSPRSCARVFPTDEELTAARCTGPSTPTPSCLASAATAVRGSGAGHRRGPATRSRFGPRARTTPRTPRAPRRWR